MTYYGEIGEVTEVSRVGTEELSVEWRIPEFSSLHAGMGDCYNSPSFRMDDESWFFRLWTNCTDEKLHPASGWVQLRLWKWDSGRSQTFRVSVGIRGSEGEEKRRVVEKEFSDDDDRNDWDDFCRRSELTEHGSRLTPGDVLVITCVIERVDPARGVSSLLSNRADSEIGQPTNRGQSSDKRDAFTQTDLQTEVPAEEKQPSEKRGIEKLSEDFANLLESGDKSDVTVQVGDVDFKVHAAVLCARSPALSVSLRHPSAEQASNKIVITDCKPEVFGDYLHYIYTGSVKSFTEQNVFGLYRVADKYLAQDLKQRCLEQIQNTLSVRTFCEAVKLALTHGESDLLQLAIHFAAENFSQIIIGVEWQNFICEYPREANEILVKCFGPRS